MQGVCIMGPLQRLVAEAEAAGAKVVLVNPALGDIPGAAGVMQVRGRGERIAFAQSFRDCYAFRCLFFAGRFCFPIVGVLRFSLADAPFWTVYRRMEGKQLSDYEAHAGAAGAGRSVADEGGAGGSSGDVEELYAPVAVYAGGGEGGALLCEPPPSEEITAVLDPKMNKRS
eukprot:CAMPEP_0179883502 /NCGR_PEP_ID=MMETSP0982-20121206/28754_1 /TAXON_ID=483367 /ORGANISM="non described non described, Strain CCMP 2436" /LENGTH=170 /DNA_ID=CAMNT_0021777965 /DNA_START=1 /DNA_END=513 /DNA_ORIENTATION=+